jgi:hypothetical protein
MGMQGQCFKKWSMKIQEDDSFEVPVIEDDKIPAVRVLSDAALRALAEAAERRRSMDSRPPMPPEIDGRDGPEPVRFGDWERKGIAVDF